MARILPHRVEIYSDDKEEFLGICVKCRWKDRKKKPEDTVIGIINALSRLTIAILGFPHIVIAIVRVVISLAVERKPSR